MSSKFVSKVSQLRASVWLFPIVLFFVVILLTSLKLSGTSIGIYHQYFYGNQTKDSNLLFGEPRGIRSDEWLVNTQRTIGQSKENYQVLNKNIGDKENVSILSDSPYKEWSLIFKPHNWSFLVMPLDYAFAFKWWLMGYLLVVSSYFFILQLVNRKSVAVLLSLSLFFSPFIQWWYLISTLGSIYYSLFICILVIKILHSKKPIHKYLLSLILAYVVTAFGLILYPPFMISCLVVVGVFLLGYLLNQKELLKNGTFFKEKLGYLLLGAVISVLTFALFINTRGDAVNTIQNTVYPGNRIVTGGNFDIPHLFSSHYSFFLQSDTRASLYNVAEPDIHKSNQSESSNFILLTPFLIIPSFILLLKYRREKNKIDWPLLLTTLLFLFVLLRLTTSVLDPVYNLLFLHLVPQKRLLIGLGLLSLIQSVAYIRLSTISKITFNKKFTPIYSLCLYIFGILMGIMISNQSLGYIGVKAILVFSLPLPLITYLFLKHRFAWGAFVYLSFSVLSTLMINPLYIGTGNLDSDSFATKIQQIDAVDKRTWAAEGVYLENIAMINGADSISGVYTYPQLDIWKKIEGANINDYNRYSHISLAFDRNPKIRVKTTLNLIAGDSIVISTEPCSEDLKKLDVKYVITETPLSSLDSCTKQLFSVKYPLRSVFIYSLN